MIKARLIEQADTLVCDTAWLAYWQTNPLYDYNRELVAPDIDVFRWLTMQLGKLLSKLFGTKFAQEYSGVVLVCIAILLLLLLLWFVYKKRPELFMRAGRNKLAYSVHEDTIYGVDFGQEIGRALDRKDYREAVRLLYLQTLKQLSDAGRIDWQLYKTPTEYIYELAPGPVCTSFRSLTHLFLRVRYGNFEATVALFEEMQALQGAIMKGGAA